MSREHETHNSETQLTPSTNSLTLLHRGLRNRDQRNNKSGSKTSSTSMLTKVNVVYYFAEREVEGGHVSLEKVSVLWETNIKLQDDEVSQTPGFKFTSRKGEMCPQWIISGKRTVSPEHYRPLGQSRDRICSEHQDRRNPCLCVLRRRT